MNWQEEPDIEEIIKNQSARLICGYIYANAGEENLLI